MEVIASISNFIWNIIVIIKDTITGTISFINGIIGWIKDYINILPNDWTSITVTALTILIGLYLYRFLK